MKFRGYFRDGKKSMVYLKSTLTHNYTVTVNGIPFHLDPSCKGLTKEMLVDKTREPVERIIYERLLKSDDIIYDIGANQGYYVLVAKGIRPMACIYAFEPIRSTFDFLKKNVVSNGLNDISVHNIGFSNFTGRSEMVVKRNKNQSVLKDVHDEEGYLLQSRPSVTDEIIDVTTLDAICQNKPLPTVIRCDIEGGEVKLIDGGSQTLRDMKSGLIFMENHMHLKKRPF